MGISINKNGESKKTSNIIVTVLSLPTGMESIIPNSKSIDLNSILIIWNKIPDNGGDSDSNTIITFSTI